MADFNVVQMTEQGILVAIERHWLTHSERQERQLARALQACAASGIETDDDGRAALTLEQWRTFKSSMVIQKAIDEVLRGR